MRRLLLPGLVALVLGLGAAALLAAAGALPAPPARAASDQCRTVFVSCNLGPGTSNWKQVDGDRLARDVERAVEELGAEGFRPISVTPITMGRQESERYRDSAWGAGYSATQGVLILAARD
ncbi:MAG: hypothetical protein JW819_04035 [Candidatus Krumholzibacteriota bacterium]|nr:hypothetical protein [Candidatus Krumholzibacteriota bacterium]